MDTAEKYLNDEFFVTMAGELPPEHIVEQRRASMEARVEDPDDPVAEWGGPSPARDHHYLGEQPPVDGWVTFYDPDLLAAGEPFKHGDFPFRSVGKDDAPWFARPDAENWSRHPIWKWQNPDADPHESLTLSPSIGTRADDTVTFHCYIRDGSIEWL